MNERKNWPAYRYHKLHEPRIFQNQQKLDNAGEGWRDKPFTDEERSEAASNDLFNKLEDTGEEKVRIKLAHGDYGPRKPLIEEWVNRNDKEREQIVKERELSIAEKSADAAQESAQAARKSADEARESRKLKRLSLILSASALLVSIISLYFSLQKDVP